jgi:hypothetical protein
LGGKFTLDGAVELKNCVVITEAVAAFKLQIALIGIRTIMHVINTITNDISYKAVKLESAVIGIESGALKMIQ